MREAEELVLEIPEPRRARGALGVFLLGVAARWRRDRAFARLSRLHAYAAVWLALAMLCSILFRSAATAALVTLSIWLFRGMLLPMLAPAVAQIIAPSDLTQLAACRHSEPPTLEWQQALARLSRDHLYGEILLEVIVALHAPARCDLPRPIRTISCENTAPK